jgi:hypothetical protein
MASGRMKSGRTCKNEGRAHDLVTRRRSLSAPDRRAIVSDPASSDEERDARNLKALRDARASGTLAAQQDALARLLDPYWGWGRSIAYGKIKGSPTVAAMPKRSHRNSSAAW